MGKRGGQAVTDDSGSKPGQGRVFTGGKDERGHGEVGLSSSFLSMVETCATLEQRGADESRPAKLHTSITANHELVQAR